MSLPRRRLIIKKCSASCTGKLSLLDSLELVTGKMNALVLCSNIVCAHILFVKPLRHLNYEINQDQYFITPRTMLSIPYMVSTFMVISKEKQNYFAINVCTGYYRVGVSLIVLHYELLFYTN